MGVETMMTRAVLVLAALIALTAAIPTFPSRIVSFQVETTEVSQHQCCTTCSGSRGGEPYNKYFSIADDSGPWLCGETCIRDSYYWIFHIFENNLTKVPNNSEHFCVSQGFTKYNSTVTHGGGGLYCTLDLYECTRPEGCPHP